MDLSSTTGHGIEGDSSRLPIHCATSTEVQRLTSSSLKALSKFLIINIPLGVFS
jgi:hypothetical protein